MSKNKYPADLYWGVYDQHEGEPKIVGTLIDKKPFQGA